MHDCDGELNHLMNACFQLHPSGPLEIKQIGVPYDLVEVKIIFSGYRRDRLDEIKSQLSVISKVISVSIQRYIQNYR